MLAIEKWQLLSHVDVLTRLCADVSSRESVPAARPAASARYHDRPDSPLRSGVGRQETGFDLPSIQP